MTKTTTWAENHALSKTMVAVETAGRQQSTTSGSRSGKLAVVAVAEAEVAVASAAAAANTAVETMAVGKR